MVAASTRLWERVLLVPQQEAVEYAANIAGIVGEVPAGADGVELVEEIDASGAVSGIKDLPELSCCFAHVASDQTVEANAFGGRSRAHQRSTNAVMVLPISP